MLFLCLWWLELMTGSSIFCGRVNVTQDDNQLFQSDTWQNQPNPNRFRVKGFNGGWETWRFSCKSRHKGVHVGMDDGIILWITMDHVWVVLPKLTHGRRESGSDLLTFHVGTRMEDAWLYAISCCVFGSCFLTSVPTSTFRTPNAPKSKIYPVRQNRGTSIVSF